MLLEPGETSSPSLGSEIAVLPFGNYKPSALSIKNYFEAQSLGFHLTADDLSAYCTHTFYRQNESKARFVFNCFRGMLFSKRNKLIASENTKNYCFY